LPNAEWQKKFFFSFKETITIFAIKSKKHQKKQNTIIHVQVVITSLNSIFLFFFCDERQHFGTQLQLKLKRFRSDVGRRVEVYWPLRPSEYNLCSKRSSGKGFLFHLRKITDPNERQCHAQVVQLFGKGKSERNVFLFVF
jgi:hypothetical protein